MIKRQIVPIRDRRNRRWGSMRASVRLEVRVTRETKDRLKALANRGNISIGIGAVIEKLALEATRLLESERR